ncbi:Histone H1 [Operophtera brumata]|uniref:Histone H1 n=1 Tax=Operophtera brumata TaxID=104452 RepID=A0A0L7KWZ0_OPEBR|nr:Histone H1 [Operophtera brumata]
MVKSAIKMLKERSGSSLKAIKKYIAAEYKVDSEKLAPFIRKYLKSAVESGALIQTKGTGASGSFKLESKSAKSAAGKKPSGVAKAKESAAASSPAKSKKGGAASSAGGKRKKATAAAASASPSKSKVAKATPKDKKAAAAAKRKPAGAAARRAASSPANTDIYTKRLVGGGYISNQEAAKLHQ